ncbi:MAG: hypothetical protein COB08_010680 [Rhodobacteraceae bacterium]|nr:hypothetical protein [Paracoccaceae bacterium]
MSLKDKILYISAPNDFIARYIERHLAQKLYGAVSKFTGR